MNKIIILLFICFYCSAIKSQEKLNWVHDSFDKDSIYGDINNDGVIDTLIKNAEYNRTFRVKIQENNGILLNKSFTYREPGNLSDLIIDKGWVIITQKYSGTGSLSEVNYYYKWIEEKADWFYMGSLDLYSIDYEEQEECSNFVPLATNINNTSNLDNTRSISIFDSVSYNNMKNKFCQSYTILKSEHERKDIVKRYNLGIYDVFDYLNYIEINVESVQKYNDIAFFLIEAGSCQQAIYILENVVSKFPQRTVAYLNLGDAYSSHGDYEEAKQAYQKYIELMKALGKECKIPQRVFDRIKE
ncbi:hypothetical protein BZG02_15915 [Labilibaculum filiforme]|uniref:Uncharacterized protein n=1 Tax=Labilibaculum filiforme TaxID=1940526 RepID=A0A2N3HTQ7_9BACT|nr:tetratricopeptide repeat protein [Labilibaculum filiforme]PKQ61438.1 hypothetical protein BZG02_15915 [Labilibaculum filiforme]